MALDVGGLYSAEHPALVGYLRRRCSSRELAEDLAQQTWLKAVRYAPTFTDRGLPARAWLFRIARSVLVDHLRRAAHTQTVSLDDASPLAAVTADAGGDRQLDDLDLTQLIDRLPPHQRDVVRARFLSGWSVEQTAAEMGSPRPTVCTRQKRALARLRGLLEEGAA